MGREIELFEDAIKDFKYWEKSGNKKIKEKIERYLNKIAEDPFSGPGKPELLKHDLSGKWSRRITKEHRIIYDVEDHKINVYSLRGHYDKKKK